MAGSLCGAFLLSGAALLLFETLWFRLSGLALGVRDREEPFVPVAEGRPAA